MKKITNFILSIFLLYITLSDFFIMQFTSLVYDYKEEAYVIMLMPMIGAIIWWIFLQFNRWRLKLWNKLVTYIGIIVAALGAFPINLIILELSLIHIFPVHTLCLPLQVKRALPVLM